MDRRLTRRVVLIGSGLGLLGWSCRGARSNTDERSDAVPIVYDEFGGLFVEASVNGRPPKRFLLDTGASHSALATAYASELGLERVAGAQVEGSAGVVDAERATATVDVPGLGAQRIDFTVYPFGSYDAECVGILGYEVLCEARFRIDYRKRRLVWNAPRPPSTTAMDRAARIPRIAAELDGVTIDLRVDTGAALAPGEEAYFNVTEDQARALGLIGTPVAVFGATGTGGAKLELPVHRLRSASVAGRSIAKAFAIVQPRVGYFARPDAIGFVGNSVLDKLDPWFDYSRGLFGVGA
jgi:hypothetical protein